MKSTLYLKFIIIYMIFGFMSLFTVATLTRTLTEEPLERASGCGCLSGSEPGGKRVICHIISLDRLMHKRCPYTTCSEWKRIWTGQSGS